ncbi:MAG TPA: hypothetical protein IAB87_02705 [Candidatus Coprenecus merdipullorum]|nr:hypothetical protein [Candidatus Coprenecus merdipullorum]
MESPFTYNTIAIGSDFLSRKKDVSHLASLIADGRHAVIYEPPRTGKNSLVNMALNQFEGNAGYDITHISLIDIIDPEDFLHRMEEVYSLPPEPRHIVYIEEFQNILRIRDWDRMLHVMEKEWQKPGTPIYIISGSGINAMKLIFEEKKFFYRMFERVRLSPIDERVISDHITRTFQKVGRVIEPHQTEYIYNITDGHPWYIWQLAECCFNLTKGYLSDNMLAEAVDTLLYTHAIRFQETVDNLSRYQLYLLRAIFDGVTKVSSSSIINKYSLNSSANVHRVKEALTKKEVVIFETQDSPRIIDPIFRVWLDRYYFKTNKTLQDK